MERLIIEGVCNKENIEKAQELTDAWDKRDPESLTNSDREDLLKIFNISEENLESIREDAVNFFENEEYEDALKRLNFLALIDSNNKLVWLHSGFCLLYMQNFEEALTSFAMVKRISPQDPISFYYAASCLIQLEKINTARLILKKCIELAQKDHEFKQIEEAAQELLEQTK